MKSAKTVLLSIALILVASCDDDTISPTGTVSPKELISQNEIGMMKGNYFHYPAKQNTDGTVSWYTDHVYFYLLDNKYKVARNSFGNPVASGLLFSQVKSYMTLHKELSDSTQWAYRVVRQVQVVDGEKVLSEQEPFVVDSVTIHSLLQRDYWRTKK